MVKPRHLPPSLPGVSLDSCLGSHALCSCWFTVCDTTAPAEGVQTYEEEGFLTTPRILNFTNLDPKGKMSSGLDDTKTSSIVVFQVIKIDCEMR